MSASTSSSSSIVSRACRLNAGTHCSVTAGDDAERADADPGDAQQLGIGVLVARARPHRCRRRARCRRRSSPGCPRPQPGAVGRRADRAGERLHVDVAEVRHRQPDRVELVGSARSVIPASTVTRPRSTIDVDAPVAWRSSESCTPDVIAAGGERVPGADHLDRCCRRAAAGRRSPRPRRSTPGARPATAGTPRCPAQLRTGREPTPDRSVARLVAWATMTIAESRAPCNGTCHHDCPDSCGWTVTVEDGVAVKLRGNPDHPYS